MGIKLSLFGGGDLVQHHEGDLFLQEGGKRECPFAPYIRQFRSHLLDLLQHCRVLLLLLLLHACALL